MLTMTLLLALSAAEPLAPQKLGVSVAAGTLGSPEGHGVALSTGIRWGLGSHFALGFDTGYGLMGQQPGLQDR